jgi:GTP-binding protein
MTIPVVAVVGRPNVGKSTLFNQLTASRQALVLDLPGTTRDRHYGFVAGRARPWMVVDTGGLENTPVQDSSLETQIITQTWQAVEEADLVLFVVDGRAGVTPLDFWIAEKLRLLIAKHNIPLLLVVNKAEGLDPNIVTADFYTLNLKAEFVVISAAHRQGFEPLFHAIEHQLPPKDPEEDLEDLGIKIAIAGRPNVGKSTLVNRLLGEARVIVFDAPGTTRDSLYIPLEKHGKHYTLIDTAGVRKRARITDTVEKFSVVKTLQAIVDANVVLLVLDGQEGLTEKDLNLLGFILEAGRAVVIVVNKWDGLSSDQRKRITQTLAYRLAFAKFAKIHYISALHGTGVGHLLKEVDVAYRSANCVLTTSMANRLLTQIIEQHPPPQVKGRRIKLRYANVGGHAPPVIVIHGNQTDQVPESYRKYLMNAFTKALRLVGTPIRIEFKTHDNPFV